jgi:hypothetical protein
MLIRQPHPKIDAKAWSGDGALVQKDRTKPFPVGSDNATGILKWRLAVTDEDMVPVSVNFWPSSESGRSVVSVEYSVKDDFLGRDPEQPFVMRNLCFALPCPYVSCGCMHCGGGMDIGCARVFVSSVPVVFVCKECSP